MGKERIIIVGAGMAGAAAAYFLARRGVKDILILEKELIAGIHSSGLNAAILRTMIAEPELNRLARESAAFYLAPPEGFSTEPLVDKTGIYLTASVGNEPTLQGWCADNPETGMEPIDVAAVYARIPALARGIGMATWKGDDGVMDVHAILQGFLGGARRAGAELRTGVEFLGLRTDGGRVTGVETSAGFMDASKVLVANGAWASCAEVFGAYALSFTPHRRHLLVTEVLPQVDARWPVMWIAGEEFYFRPESGGLLMCGCDAVAVAPDQGEVTDTAQIEGIASKAARWLPSLENVRVAKAWAGMRTFVPDDLFVIGADPRLEGLYWNAGLGGHGVTCAPAHGRLAADWIADGGSPHPAATSLAPARLIR
ncbi:MAG: FAD-binding oxidoreductase [Acidobacteriota bacterium]|nr:FAD-binding oxidoreductase [Acidobacteriota bacterium]